MCVCVCVSLTRTLPGNDPSMRLVRSGPSKHTLSMFLVTVTKSWRDTCVPFSNAISSMSMMADIIICDVRLHVEKMAILMLGTHRSNAAAVPDVT